MNRRMSHQPRRSYFFAGDLNRSQQATSFLKVTGLASRAGLPLSTFALQELSETARRADNAELLQALPSADLETGEILDALRQSRAEH